MPSTTHSINPEKLSIPTNFIFFEDEKTKFFRQLITAIYNYTDPDATEIQKARHLQSVQTLIAQNPKLLSHVGKVTDETETTFTTTALQFARQYKATKIIEMLQERIATATMATKTVTAANRPR